MPARSLCVYCRQREVEARFRPFCSDRCKHADLGRWLTGDYRIAAEPAFDEETTSVEDASDRPTRQDD
jgi:endogenous inhibitor of DNA gyrase (YacG/DUF329 family)